MPCPVTLPDKTMLKMKAIRWTPASLRQVPESAPKRIIMAGKARDGVFELA